MTGLWFLCVWSAFMVAVAVWDPDALEGMTCFLLLDAVGIFAMYSVLAFFFKTAWHLVRSGVRLLWS